MDYLRAYGTHDILDSKQLDIVDKIFELIKNELPEEIRSYGVIEGIIDRANSVLKDKIVNL